jgi:uncharacterized protein YggU (UPF0235/DUF167 family)
MERFSPFTSNRKPRPQSAWVFTAMRSKFDGAANDALVRFLAQTLTLPLAAVRIESGTSGRHKRVRLRGVMADRVIARLMQKGPTE